ncbi:hypothetical protein L484_022209 [Morus notabilis]|uniref:Uncharacterized protein n=1 Tax=Morus notabilis TaxID=981085 RepID=W9R018_9ROSA|nr:hypothetical protein L484_022209 [Morus notabilis]
MRFSNFIEYRKFSRTKQYILLDEELQKMRQPPNRMAKYKPKKEKSNNQNIEVFSTISRIHPPTHYSDQPRIYGFFRFHNPLAMLEAS